MGDDKAMSGTHGHDPLAIDDEAIDWLAQLHSGQATDRDRAAFARWRGQSAAHEAAAHEAEAMWDEMGHTPTAAAFVPDTPHRAGRRSLPLARSAIARRAFLGSGLAASAGGLALLSGVAGPAAGLFADYRTARGERRREILPDGSTVWLNSGTALSADFSGGARRLTLHAGEALFDVKKDIARPFIVSAGGGEARALGTFYAVRADQAGWQVDVAEGTVSVQARPGTEQRRITAGQRLAYRDGRFLAEKEDINTAAIGSWRRDKLIFNHRPLGQVVAELQRHRYGRILITDERIAALPVTGVFDLYDDEASFAMLRESLPLTIRHFPLLTIISPAKND